MRWATTVAIAAASAYVVSALACTGSDPVIDSSTAGDSGGVDVAPATFDMTVRPGAARVVQDDAVDIGLDVHVTRSPSFTGAVAISSMPIPGVTVSENKTEPIAPDTQLLVHATSAAAQGEHTLTIVATAEGFPPVTRDVQLTVAGPPGTLDSTFGDGGIVVTSYDKFAYVAAMALAPDGKVVVCGTTVATAGGSFPVLARYAADGALDPTFGSGGVVTGLVQGSCRALAVQASGRVVVAGGVAADGGVQNDFVVLGFTPAGEADASFGSQGRVIVDFGGDDVAQGITIVDSKPEAIVVVGQAGTDFGIAKLSKDGVLDTTFDGDGKVTTDFAGQTDVATAVAASGGKIIVAGRATQSAAFDFAVARYSFLGGELDQSFASTGKVVTAVSSDNDEPSAIAVQGDGRIVVTGFSGSPSAFTAVRYLTTGMPDDTFGNGGIVRTPLGFVSDARGVAIDGTGRLVAAGLGSTSRNLFAVARYDSGGKFDPRFGDGGATLTAIGTANDQAYAIVLMNSGDDRILLGGTSEAPAGTSRLALARYWP